MGTLSGIRHPSFFACPSVSKLTGHTPGALGPASLSERYGGEDRSIKSGVPFGKRGGVCSRSAVSPGDESAESPGQCSCRNLSSLRGCRTGVRGPSRGFGGGLVEQVAGNVEKGESPTLPREPLEIRLAENLDGLFAGVKLDTTGALPKSTSLASSIRSSNDGVGHCRLVLRVRWRPQTRMG
jgi:hypothetical protein